MYFITSRKSKYTRAYIYCDGNCGSNDRNYIMMVVEVTVLVVVVVVLVKVLLQVAMVALVMAMLVVPVVGAEVTYIGHLRRVIGHVAPAGVTHHAVKSVVAAAVTDRRLPRKDDC